MRTISVHQPNYFPWLGYFYKISRSDIFVILDDVDFQTGNSASLTNRTKLKGANGTFWLTVPVKKNNTTNLIRDIKIDYQQPWETKHLKTFANVYGKSRYFSDYYDLFKSVLTKEYSSLAELNSALIYSVNTILNIRTEIVLSSELDLPEVHKDEKVAAICVKLGATHYLSGSGAMKYNRVEVFDSAGIKLVYSGFIHPVYPQNYGEFIPGLGITDLLFNCGQETVNYLK